MSYVIGEAAPPLPTSYSTGGTGIGLGMGVSGRGSGTFPSPVLGTTTALPTGPFPHLQIPDPTQHLTSVAAFPSAPLLAASSASLKTNIFVLGVAHSNTTGAAAGSATSSNNDISPTNGLGSNTSLAGGAGSGKDANGLRMVLLSTISLPHAALHLAFSPGRTNNDGAHDLLSSSHSGRVLHLRVTPGKGTVRPQVEWLREIPCFPNPQTVAAKPGRMAPSSRVQKSLFFGVPGQSLPTGLSFASISGPTVATWDLQQASGSSIAAFPNNDDSLLGLATVQARTDIVATSSAGGALMLVDLRVGDSGSPGGHGLSKAAVWSVKRAHGPRSIPTVAFHPAGSYLASGGEDGTVRVWDVRYAGSTIPVANDEETGYVNYVAASGKESAGGRITDILWSPSQPHILTYAALDRTVRTVSILPYAPAPQPVSQRFRSSDDDADHYVPDADDDDEAESTSASTAVDAEEDDGRWMDPLEARWWSYIRAVQGDNADSDKPASSQKPLPMVSLERTKLGSPGAPMSLAWHPRFPSVVFAGSGTGEIFSVALSNGRIAVPRPPADEKDDDPKMAALRRFPSVAAELYNRDYISAAREAAMAVSTGDVDAGTARALLACLPTEAAKDSSWTPQSQGGDARPEFRKQIELFSLGMQPPLKAPPPLPAPLPTILAALQLRLELEDRVAAGKWEAVAKRAREVVAGVESEFSGSGWSIPVWTGEVLLKLVSPVIVNDLLRGASLAARIAQIVHSSSIPNAAFRFRTLAPLLYLALYPTVFDPESEITPMSGEGGPESPRFHWDWKVAAVRARLESGEDTVRQELLSVLSVGELVMPMLKLEIALLKLIAKGPTAAPNDSPTGSLKSVRAANIDPEIIRIFMGHHSVGQNSPTGLDESEPERTVSLTANRLYLDAMLREGRWEGYWGFAVDLFATYPTTPLPNLLLSHLSASLPFLKHHIDTQYQNASSSLSSAVALAASGTREELGTELTKGIRVLSAGLKDVGAIATAMGSAPPGGENFFVYVATSLAGMAGQLSTSLFRIMEMMDRIVGREAGGNFVRKAAEGVLVDLGEAEVPGKLGAEIEELKLKLVPYLEE